MKYSEFREYLKSNDFGMRENDEMIIADDQFEISKRVQCSIWFLRDNIEYSYEYELLKKVIELAETPLSEREEEKKYYIKHRFISNLRAEKYINLSITGTVTIRDHLGSRYCKTKFTKAEIEAFKKRFDTDLKDFELIEAED